MNIDVLLWHCVLLGLVLIDDACLRHALWMKHWLSTTLAALLQQLNGEGIENLSPT